MMLACKGKKSIIMKNRSLSGMAILCFFLSAFFISCKKEDVQNDSSTESTAYFEDYPNDDPSYSDEQSLLTGESPDSVDDFADTNTVSMSAVTTSAYTRKNLMFNYSTESSDALSKTSCGSSNYWCSISKWASYSAQRTSAYRRSGGYSTRYELRKTDGDVAGSKRTETNRYSQSEPVLKCERWYGVSYYLPSSFVSDKAPELLTQWHTVAGGSPPLVVWTQNGQWSIGYFGDKRKVIGNYVTNKWTDFVFHVKWSPYSDGFIEAWKDGVKVFTYTGANIYKTSYGAYMKTGIYKWPWKSGSYGSTTTNRVVYIDDVRIGNSLATYNDVAPGP
jgi:Polysaccharide lyase